MLIGKTIIDKKNIQLLGRRVYNTTRTHKNDLIALRYMYDQKINEFDAIRGTTSLDSIIFYTFGWAMRPEQFSTYCFDGIETKLDKTIDEEENTIYFCIFTGTLHTWLLYCVAGKPQAFTAMIKHQLTEDGYGLLLKEQKCLK